VTGGTARRGMLLGLGAVWWGAAVGLAVAPGAGALEGAVAAGGWGLSLLPVHCVAKARAAGTVARREGRAGARAGVTRAWPRHRSGGGSGPW
jgi:hypothetical protein